MITTSTLDGKAAAQAMAEAAEAHKVELVGEALMPFGSTDFVSAFSAAKAKEPTAIILNLYGWDLVHALKGYGKLELAKEKIGIGGMISGEQIGRPLGYANNAGIWGLIWDPKINTDSSGGYPRRDRQVQPYANLPVLFGVCCDGRRRSSKRFSALVQPETAALIKAPALTRVRWAEGRTVQFRASDHQHVRDVLVGEAFEKNWGWAITRCLCNGAGPREYWGGGPASPQIVRALQSRGLPWGHLS